MSKKTTQKPESRKASPRAKRAKATEAAPRESSNEIGNAAAPTVEQIRDRAYQIFRNGMNPRDPVADWFQAERELKNDASV